MIGETQEVRSDKRKPSQIIKIIEVIEIIEKENKQKNMSPRRPQVKISKSGVSLDIQMDTIT